MRQSKLCFTAHDDDDYSGHAVTYVIDARVYRYSRRDYTFTLYIGAYQPIFHARHDILAQRRDASADMPPSWTPFQQCVLSYRARQPRAGHASNTSMPPVSLRRYLLVRARSGQVGRCATQVAMRDCQYDDDEVDAHTGVYLYLRNLKVPSPPDGISHTNVSHIGSELSRRCRPSTSAFSGRCRNRHRRYLSLAAPPAGRPRAIAGLFRCREPLFT